MILLAGAATKTIVKFHALVTSVSITASWQSDLGLVTSGGVTWTDQVNGHTLTESTNPPTVNMTGLNGFPTLSFNGTNQQLQNTDVDLPAPGTTPTFHWVVLRVNTWAINHVLLAGKGSAACALIMSTSTPTISQENPTVVNPNTGAAVAAFVRGEALFSNTTGDYLKLGSSKVTGANAGNTDPTVGLWLGRANGGTFTGMTVAAWMITQGAPNSTELSNLSAAVTSKYGVSVGV